jgi:hypothetical protein
MTTTQLQKKNYFWLDLEHTLPPNTYRIHLYTVHCQARTELEPHHVHFTIYSSYKLLWQQTTFNLHPRIYTHTKNIYVATSSTIVININKTNIT